MEPIRILSAVRLTDVTPTLSEADITTFTVPLTVAPLPGDVMLTVGGIPSAPGLLLLEVDCSGF